MAVVGFSVFSKRETAEEKSMIHALRINAKDNVATCLRAVAAGETVAIGAACLTATTDVPAYHKIAISAIPAGGLCIKYGEAIGVATAEIEAGAHVHLHNLESARGRGDLNVAEGATQ